LTVIQTSSAYITDEITDEIKRSESMYTSGILDMPQGPPSFKGVQRVVVVEYHALTRSPFDTDSDEGIERHYIYDGLRDHHCATKEKGAGSGANERRTLSKL
jgi:hypothetical protein